MIQRGKALLLISFIPSFSFDGRLSKLRQCLFRLSLSVGGQWALFFFFKKKSFSLFLFAENLYYAKFPEFTDVLFMVEKQPFSHMIILS